MPIAYEGAGAVAENNAAATTLNVPYPPNTAAGDALVLWVTVASATVATLPSGWIAGGVSSSSGGNLPSERIMVKIATGSETGSLAVTTASATSRGGMMRFTGVDNTTPIDGTGSVTASATATNSYVLPSLTTTPAGCALITVACANAPGGTWTTPTTQGGGWTEVAETTGAVPSTGVDYLIWSGSGATGTVPMTRSTSVRGCSGMLALRPASTSANQGTSAATLPGLASVAAAAVILAGTVAASLPALSSSATGASTAAAASASTLPSLSSAASGVAVNPGSSAASLPALSSASSGTSQTAGSVASPLPPLTSAAAGTSRASGTSSATLPALTSAATGAGSNPTATGTSASTLPALTSTALAATVARGTSAATLPALVTSATGSAKGAATHVVTLPSLTSAAAGDLTTPGAVAVFLPGLTSASSAETNEPEPPTEFEGRILAARITAPLAIGELDVADTTSTIGTTSASGRITIPTATGVLT